MSAPPVIPPKEQIDAWFNRDRIGFETYLSNASALLSDPADYAKQARIGMTGSDRPLRGVVRLQVVTFDAPVRSAGVYLYTISDDNNNRVTGHWLTFKVDGVCTRRYMKPDLWRAQVDVSPDTLTNETRAAASDLVLPVVAPNDVPPTILINHRDLPDLLLYRMAGFVELGPKKPA